MGLKAMDERREASCLDAKANRSLATNKTTVDENWDRKLLEIKEACIVRKE